MNLVCPSAARQLAGVLRKEEGALRVCKVRSTIELAAMEQQSHMEERYQNEVVPA
jgi:hypothetical protein